MWEGTARIDCGFDSGVLNLPKGSGGLARILLNLIRQIGGLSYFGCPQGLFDRGKDNWLYYVQSEKALGCSAKTAKDLQMEIIDLRAVATAPVGGVAG